MNTRIGMPLGNALPRGPLKAGAAGGFGSARTFSARGLTEVSG